MNKEIEKVQNIIRKLEQVNERRIRAEERIKIEEKKLKELGYDSVEEAEDGYKQLSTKLDKTIKRFKKMYSEFMEDYENVL